MSIQPRKCRRAISLLVVGAMAFAGACSASASDGATSRGLIVAETTAPSTLDPQASDLLADRAAWTLAYQCLLTTNATGTVEPLLATSYTKSPDGLSYTFQLRKGVQFHNGATLTSRDVVYTFTRLFSSGSPSLRALFNNYKSVVADGPYAVTFKLSAPNAGFISAMASPAAYGCGIISKAAVATIATKMVGTGPWQQTSYQPDVDLSMKRFASYWGTKTAAPTLRVLYVPQINTQVTDLSAGKVNLILPPQTSVSQLAGNNDIKVSKVASDQTVFLMLNQNKPPFNNVDVRRAVAVALDRGNLAKLAYQGGATPSAYVPPSYTWATQLDKLPDSSRNVDQAKRLLAKAGYPKGLSTSLNFIVNYDPGTNALVAQMQAQLAEAGIRVKLVPQQTTDWVQGVITRGDYEMSWNEQTYYSNPFQYVAVPGYRIGPKVGTVPDELVKLTGTALAAASVSEFNDGVNKVQQWEADQAYPTITLLALDQYVAYNKRLSNVSVSPSSSRDFLANVGVSSD